MTGTIALAAVAMLAIGFLGLFFVALCRERRHIGICMLLRQDANFDAPGVADPLPRSETPAVRSTKVTIVSSRTHSSVTPLRSPNQWLK